ncbi:MAG TPA: hypothetical protein ENK02_15035 [Planctomycetes bacterium]|nr:hypothetical protein [Planctomycetota bacterium]
MRPFRKEPASSRLLVLLLLLLGSLSGSCGYSMGFSGKKLGIRSLAIQTVDNQSFWRGFGSKLTRRLGQDLTRYAGILPGTQEQADAILKVQIKDVQGRMITGEGEEAIREAALLIAASWKIVDRKTGKEIETGKALDWAEYRVPVGENRSSAQKEAIGDLSRRILISLGAQR